jgi:hypothetical protein
MHRDDAQTVRFSHIIVANDTVTFAYTPSAPCHNTPAKLTAMALGE